MRSTGGTAWRSRTRTPRSWIRAWVISRGRSKRIGRGARARGAEGTPSPISGAKFQGPVASRSRRTRAPSNTRRSTRSRPFSSAAASTSSTTVAAATIGVSSGERSAELSPGPDPGESRSPPISTRASSRSSSKEVHSPSSPPAASAARAIGVRPTPSARRNPTTSAARISSRRRQRGDRTVAWGAAPVARVSPVAGAGSLAVGSVIARPPPAPRRNPRGRSPPTPWPSSGGPPCAHAPVRGGSYPGTVTDRVASQSAARTRAAELEDSRDILLSSISLERKEAMEVLATIASCTTPSCRPASPVNWSRSALNSSPQGSLLEAIEELDQHVAFQAPGERVLVARQGPHDRAVRDQPTRDLLQQVVVREEGELTGELRLGAGREVQQGCPSRRRVGERVDALPEANQLALLEPEHLATLGPLEGRVTDLGADPLHLTFQGGSPGGRGRPQDERHSKITPELEARLGHDQERAAIQGQALLEDEHLLARCTAQLELTAHPIGEDGLDLVAHGERHPQAPAACALLPELDAELPVHQLLLVEPDALGECRRHPGRDSGHGEALEELHANPAVRGQRHELLDHPFPLLAREEAGPEQDSRVGASRLGPVAPEDQAHAFREGLGGLRDRRLDHQEVHGDSDGVLLPEAQGYRGPLDHGPAHRVPPVIGDEGEDVGRSQGFTPRCTARAQARWTPTQPPRSTRR